MSHDIQQCIKNCEEVVNGRLTIVEKVLEHPCAFKVGLNVVAIVLFVHLGAQTNSGSCLWSR